MERLMELKLYGMAWRVVREAGHFGAAAAVQRTRCQALPATSPQAWDFLPLNFMLRLEAAL